VGSGSVKQHVRLKTLEKVGMEVETSSIKGVVVVEVGIFYQHKLPITCHIPVWKGYSSVLVTKRLARYLKNAGRMV